MASDYYTVLEVGRNASTSEIRSAFRRLAKTWHPDRNKSPGAEERFREVNTAYQILSDPVLREKYDALREPHQRPQQEYRSSERAQTRIHEAWQWAMERDSREAAAAHQDSASIRDIEGIWPMLAWGIWAALGLVFLINLMIAA